jgi:hypothetical protein
MDLPMSVDGRCACGAITLRIHGALGALTFCHCRACRKVTSAPYLAALPVALAALELNDPHAARCGYRSSSNKVRYFCGRCGSPLYSHRDGASEVRVRAGLLDLPSAIAHVGHIFCGESAAWDAARDSLPRFDAFEPGRAPSGAGNLR